jgi:hypothetical protein
MLVVKVSTFISESELFLESGSPVLADIEGEVGGAPVLKSGRIRGKGLSGDKCCPP